LFLAQSEESAESLEKAREEIVSLKSKNDGLEAHQLTREQEWAQERKRELESREREREKWEQERQRQLESREREREEREREERERDRKKDREKGSTNGLSGGVERGRQGGLEERVKEFGFQRLREEGVMSREGWGAGQGDEMVEPSAELCSYEGMHLFVS